MDWDKLKIFHAVAEAGSFTNATVNLNLSQSAISRQIQSLEQNNARWAKSWFLNCITFKGPIIKVQLYVTILK